MYEAPRQEVILAQASPLRLAGETSMGSSAALPAAAGTGRVCRAPGAASSRASFEPEREKQNENKTTGGPGAPGAATCRFRCIYSINTTENSVKPVYGAERTRRGNNKLHNTRELLGDSLFARDGLLLHAAGVPGQPWLGGFQVETNAGPLPRMTSPLSRRPSGGACVHPGCLLQGAAKRKTSAGMVPCACEA